MTRSVQVYTLDGSTRTAIQPASLQTYSCECRAMCTARLCNTHHSRCTTVRTVLPGLCAGSGLTFYNNGFRIKARPVNCGFGPTAIPVRIRGLNVQPETLPLQRSSEVALEVGSSSFRDNGLSICTRGSWGCYTPREYGSLKSRPVFDPKHIISTVSPEPAR